MATRLLALVERNTSTRIPVRVFDFEVPILEAIHGPGIVSVKEGTEEAATIDDYDKVWDNLITRYGGAHVHAVFRSKGDFVRTVREFVPASGDPNLPDVPTPGSKGKPAK